MGLLAALFSKKAPTIKPPEAYRRLQADKRVIIVDVRQPVETRAGSVPGAVLIPLTEFGRRLGELPRDRNIHVICRSGGRAYYATRVLLQNGFNAKTIAGGMLSRYHSQLLPD